MDVMLRIHAVEIVPETQPELIGLFGSEKENVAEKSGEEPRYPKCEFIPESEDEDETFDPNLEGDVHVQAPFRVEGGEDRTRKDGAEEAAHCSTVCAPVKKLKS